MRGRGNTSIVANPVLVGAVTTLVVLVAVFLAYNANNGLPFVPTRALNVQVDNGAELVPGNEVRSGGYRIGVVQAMTPVRVGGRVVALLKLKLDRKFGAVPVDSTVVIRPRSSLGLKYVEFQRGTSRRTIPDGGTLPLGHTKVPVELDEFNNMFDKPTRDAARTNLRGFGDALIGRGPDLNTTIAALPRFFGGLRDVMANLSDPRTDLPNFFRQLGITAHVVAPISRINAQNFTDMATTFEAISRDPRALQETISKNVPTLRVGTESLRVQQPFLVDTAKFSHDLRFVASDLRAALPPLNDALKVGIPVTRRSAATYDQLRGTLDALDRLVNEPTTAGAVRGLIATVDTLQPQLRFLGPYVTVCNYWNFFWTYTAEHFTAPDATGGSERALLNQANGDPDSVGSMGANEFVHGVPTQSPQHMQNGGRPQDVHNNTVGGYAIHPDGRADCMKGQQGYAYGLNRFRPAGYDAYNRAVVDQPVFSDTPDFGPTYRAYDAQRHPLGGLNAARVPAGETFTQNPGGTAQQLPSGGLPNQNPRPKP